MAFLDGLSTKSSPCFLKTPKTHFRSTECTIVSFHKLWSELGHLKNFSFFTALTRSTCGLRALPVTVEAGNKVGLLYPKHSILTPMFNYWTKRMAESGALRRLEEAYIPRMNFRCIPSLMPEAISYTLVGFVFAILCGGASASILVVASELIWAHCISRKLLYSA